MPLQLEEKIKKRHVIASPPTPTQKKDLPQIIDDCQQTKASSIIIHWISENVSCVEWSWVLSAIRGSVSGVEMVKERVSMLIKGREIRQKVEEDPSLCLCDQTEFTKFEVKVKCYQAGSVECSECSSLAIEGLWFRKTRFCLCAVWDQFQDPCPICIVQLQWRKTCSIQEN